MQAEETMRIEGLIFDMDGTLADSIGYYYQIACDVTDLVGAPRPSRERVCELMGRADPDLLRRILPDDFPHPESALARVQEHFRRRRPFVRSFDPLPGCVDTLRELHRAGVRLGIATSANRDLPSLDTWQVRDLFTAIVGREDVTHRKPHPEALVHCLQLLEVEPSQATYVGDSEVDIEAGRRAGLRTIGVLTGTGSEASLRAAGADLILDSASLLISVLESHNGLGTPKAPLLHR